MRCTYIDKTKNWGFGIILIIENTVCMYLCIYLFRKFASSATLPFAPNVCQLRNSSTSESQLALKRSPRSESYLAPKRFPQLQNASPSSKTLPLALKCFPQLRNALIAPKAAQLRRYARTLGLEPKIFLATTSSESVASLVKGSNLSKGLCWVKKVEVHFSERSEGK